MLLLSGCETLIQTPQQRQQMAVRQQAAARVAEERVTNLQGRLQTLEMEYGQLVKDNQQLRDQVASCNSQIAQLNSNMQALQSKQASEMREVIKRVEKLVGQAVATKSSSGTTSQRGPGRIHVVQKGHTLSAIAQAYGTTVEAIKKANHLKSDNIYVGQKLFIPDN